MKILFRSKLCEVFLKWYPRMCYYIVYRHTSGTQIHETLDAKSIFRDPGYLNGYSNFFLIAMIFLAHAEFLLSQNSNFIVIQTLPCNYVFKIDIFVSRSPWRHCLESSLWPNLSFDVLENVMMIKQEACKLLMVKDWS